MYQAPPAKFDLHPLKKPGTQLKLRNHHILAEQHQMRPPMPLVLDIRSLRHEVALVADKKNQALIFAHF